MEITFENGTAQMRKAIPFTSRDVERQIEGFRYAEAYSNVKSELSGKRNAAEDMMLPPMIVPFYGRVFFGEVPSPDGFIRVYFSYYEGQFEVSGDEIAIGGKSASCFDVYARLLRAYPSLIRDLHFYLMLSESGKFDTVRYSTSEDYGGEDITVVYEGTQITVSLMTQTRRASEYKSRKNAYRHTYMKPELELKIDLGKVRRCGDFKLYDESDVSKVLYFAIKANAEEATRHA